MLVDVALAEPGERIAPLLRCVRLTRLRRALRLGCTLLVAARRQGARLSVVFVTHSPLLVGVVVHSAEASEFCGKSGEERCVCVVAKAWSSASRDLMTGWGLWGCVEPRIVSQDFALQLL